MCELVRVTVGAAVEGKREMLKLAVQRSEGMLHNATLWDLPQDGVQLHCLLTQIPVFQSPQSKGEKTPGATREQRWIV